VSEPTLDDAWKEVSRLVRTNARHRKGFSLGEISCDKFVLEQAADEMKELQTALVRYEACITGTDQEVADELGDVLGVLFHFAIRMGYTPETLSRSMLAKFKQRFST
jgi:uncharacterized protein YabN with tetrapyrrole methylase and pyrophosphatase domain